MYKNLFYCSFIYVFTVFFSTCDSVDAHTLLFREASWPTVRAPTSIQTIFGQQINELHNYF